MTFETVKEKLSVELSNYTELVDYIIEALKNNFEKITIIDDKGGAGVFIVKIKKINYDI